MKTVTITLLALTISLVSFGSLKPIKSSNSRSPAFDKQSVSLKTSIKHHLIANVK